MKTLYIECAMGAAGDMLMSALYELLEDKKGFLDKMNHLGLPQVELVPQEKTTCGICGTHMAVTVNGEEETEAAGHKHHHHATPGHIRGMIDGFDLPEEVKEAAGKVYDRIAEAEAKAHGCPVSDVHFHEVGALDAVADVTGVCYALYLLKPDQVIVSPIHVGTGTVRCAHGIMPVPAPATANLLENVPVYGGEVQGELCTPTGAALLVQLADSFGSMPAMRIQHTGVGIGTKVFEQANCVRAFLGETEDENRGDILELVCNIDDMTPEALSFACSRLLEAGALDAYIVPGTMKKGRSGHLLTVLCQPDQEEMMAKNILKETTTNGLRVRRCGKYFLTPGSDHVITPWGKVRVKTAKGYGILHMKPEYDDAARLAKEQGISYQQVLAAVLSRLTETMEGEGK